MSRSMSKSKAVQSMKESLLRWICVHHATDQRFDRPMLKQAALEFVSYWDVEGYKCGESWLTQFLKRYKFSPSLTDCGGPEFDDYTDWIEIMRPFLSGYQYEDQFFLDELMMYTDFQPNSHPNEPAREINLTGSSVDFEDDSLNFKAQKPPAMNIVSMILAVNASGTEKIPPIISGRYKIESPCQGCTYQSDNLSRINDGVLAGWLRSIDNRMADSNRRIILVLNRSHVNAVKFARLTHIQPVYLPNKFPSKLRPLRRDVCHFIKMYYRSCYVQGLCQEPTKDFWEPEEIINCLVEAWNKVSPELIIVNFQRTKFRTDDSYLNINCPLWHTLKIGVSFEKFVTFDDCLSEARDANFNVGVLECISNVDSDLRRSFSRDGSVSKSNIVDDSMSSRDFDGSLKRPSDDSVDGNSCEPMDYSNVHRDFPIHNQDTPQQNIHSPTAEPDNCPEESDEITDWKSAGSEKTVINLATDRSAGSDQVDSINSSDVNMRNSPVDSSTPIIDKSSSNTIINLDQKYDRFNSEAEKFSQMIYPSSPVPSTSKQGLEESFALQRLYSGGADHFYNNNIHQLTPTVIRSPRVDVFMERVNEAGAGDGDDNSKRSRPNEDTCIHTPAIENYDYVEEPPSKKIKCESHWSDCYQQQPVFGPNYHNSLDHPVNLQTVAAEPTDATENVEMEKRSIFTITDNTQGHYGINEK